MNVGAILSMQNLGQVSSKGVSPKTNEREQGTLFSSLLAKVPGGTETTEQMNSGMMDILQLLQVIRSEDSAARLGNKAPDLNIEDILSQAGIPESDFVMAVTSIMDSVVKEIPQLKEVFPLLEEGNQEEVLFQLIDTISRMPVENLKKLDFRDMETLLKTSKAFDQVFKQTDLSFHQTERAETLHQNLKAIAHKIEQLLTGYGLKSGKWDQILENVFNKSAGEKVPLLTIPANKSIQPNQIILSETLGNKMVNLEGEQSAKANTATSFTGYFGQHQMTRMEQFSLFVNKSQSGTTYEQFVKEFSTIIGKSQLIQTPNMSKLLIKLYPEQLGSLRIELLQQDGIMTAKILTSTKAARDILDSQLTGLRQALNSQNLQVDKIEIAQSFTETNRQERQPSQQQQNGQQPKDQPNQQSNDNEDPETTFKDLLMNSEI